MTDMIDRSITRRGLLKSSGLGAGLFVLWNSGVTGQNATPVSTPTPEHGTVNTRGLPYETVFYPDPEEIDSHLKIGEDGTVTLFTSKIEFGQGIKTAFAQLVAEELSLSTDDVIVDMGDTGKAPPAFGTYGSLSVRTSGPVIRSAAATMNAWLLELAADELNTDASELESKNGVISGPDGEVTFADLAAGKVSGRSIDPEVSLKDSADYTEVGQSIPRVDVTDKVIGKQIYGVDVEIDGMVYGKILRPPTIDAILLDVDFTEALAAPGIVDSVHIPEKNFAAIVGERKDDVDRAIQLVKAEWQELESDTNSENIFDRLKETATDPVSLDEEGHDKDPLAALDEAGVGETYTYKLPYLAHAPIEPKSAMVNITPEQVEVWVSTQDVFSARAAVAKTLGRDEEEVLVHGMHPGGAFGSKVVPQAELECAWIANAVDRPVKLVWDRIEEIQFGQFRPAMRIEVTTGLDDDGKIVGWNYDAYTAGYYPEGAAEPTASASDWSANLLEIYEVESSKTQLLNGVSPLPPFFWRVNGATSNTYAREATMDILAEKAGMDPVSFRDSMLANNPRMAAVMHAAVDSSGWNPGVGSTGQGYGLAIGFDANTFIAEVAKVEVDEETGELTILQIDAALDPGLVVNPEGVKHQIEGGILMSLSTAIREGIDFEGGKILNGTMATYNPIRMGDTPAIVNTTIISDPNEPMGGIGEPGVAPVIGAVANAIYDAVGVRLFQAPFTPERILAALEEANS